jgi:hypothetical protein
MPGMKSSQMPDVRMRMGWRRSSHSLKSPMTLTISALGAHTAKRTPGPLRKIGDVCAEHAVGFEIRALGVQVQIEIGQQRGKR